MLVNKTSATLIGLELESNDIIKSKAMEFIVKKILPNYK